jgi:hypothetical protein
VTYLVERLFAAVVPALLSGNRAHPRRMASLAAYNAIARSVGGRLQVHGIAVPISYSELPARGSCKGSIGVVPVHTMLVPKHSLDLNREQGAHGWCLHLQVAVIRRHGDGRWAPLGRLGKSQRVHARPRQFTHVSDGRWYNALVAGTTAPHPLLHRPTSSDSN